MKRELISVIVPIYEVEKYIHKCVDSILQQIYADLEIILVDDGSTDSCPQICDEYARIDSRIQVIHKKNGGLSSARNAGLDVASGEYIAFVDGDDYIHPEMLENLYYALEDTGADMSACNLRYVDEAERPLEEYPDHVIRKETIDVDGIFHRSLEAYGYYYIVVWNKLYKKYLWDSYRFQEGKIHEDEFAFHNIVRQCGKIACIPDVGYYYVQHEGSIMAGESVEGKMDGAEAFLERLDSFVMERKLQLLPRMDAKCFYQICDVKKMYKGKSRDIRFRELTETYGVLHRQVLSIAGDPMLFKIKRSIYGLSPSLSRACSAIKAALRKVKHGMEMLDILLQYMRARLFSESGKCIYFISTPIHGNLGDQAIVYAQHCMMSECGFGKAVVEITRPAYGRLCGWLGKLVHKDDLIVIDGGGNLGTLWMEEEEKMRDIVQRFSQNPIFIFPQTAYYEQSHYGQKELKKSAEIYSGHRNLTILCRDRITYGLVKENFHGVKSFYTPDMVPFLSDVQRESERDGILLCLRKDLESVREADFLPGLKAGLLKKGYSVRETSTLVDRKVTKWNRRKELEKKWKEFSSAELIITDRLHGMIFSAVTGTPCIALDNISHKVRDGYEWLCSLPYVVFCDDSMEKVLEKAEAVCMERTEYRYGRDSLEPYYTKIKEEVKNAFNKK